MYALQDDEELHWLRQAAGCIIIGANNWISHFMDEAIYYYPAGSDIYSNRSVSQKFAGQSNVWRFTQATSRSATPRSKRPWWHSNVAQRDGVWVKMRRFYFLCLFDHVTSVFRSHWGKKKEFWTGLSLLCLTGVNDFTDAPVHEVLLSDSKVKKYNFWQEYLAFKAPMRLTTVYIWRWTQAGKSILILEARYSGQTAPDAQENIDFMPLHAQTTSTHCGYLLITVCPDCLRTAWIMAGG